MNLSGSTISFPFRPDVRGSIAVTSERSEIIVQAVQDILETRQGERVMLPDYGLPDFIFAVQNFGFAARIAYFLEEQILKYCPLVASVSAKAQTDSEGRAVVNLTYTETGEFASPRNLVFPVWQYMGDK